LYLNAPGHLASLFKGLRHLRRLETLSLQSNVSDEGFVFSGHPTLAELEVTAPTTRLTVSFHGDAPFLDRIALSALMLRFDHETQASRFRTSRRLLQSLVEDTCRQQGDHRD